ncbi:MAG TPA: SpoIIE family protein phosphatase [Kofleriaceae bacterium]|nr:SpoIIE family protein phosphatase [Kofleriaceae bacterium]
MFDLRWNWLCLPYAVCATALAAIGVVAALVRGDRVMRLGVIGAATAALPWAICSSLASGTLDPAVAVRLLRLGSGPVSLIGPNLLLVLLGVSGQLERHRWVASVAGIVGTVLLGLCWGTDWTIPGVHRLSSGVYYVSAGPLTDVHILQLWMWLAVGLVIARRSMMRNELRGMMRVLMVALVLAAIGGTDMLLVHGVVGIYPIAWLPATIACGITLYLELRTDLLRPRGFDRSVLFELSGVFAAAALVGALAFVLEGAAPVAVAAIGSAVWMSVTAITWGLGRRRRPRRVFGERALERFAVSLTDIDDERPIAAGLIALWQQVSIEVRAMWRVERAEPVPRAGAGAPGGPAELTEIATGARGTLDREVVAWLVVHAEPLAAADLATMRLGSIRPTLEAVVAARGATLFVPLIDRGTLVGLVEADHVRALREAERGLVGESARVAARALTYVHLARIAAQEGATARELEVADAMRLQASASRDDEFGPWVVGAEYRSAAPTTGAAWSASLVGDGRLALLVTEGQAHGVAAAFATAALTGAFVAATVAPRAGSPHGEPSPQGDSDPRSGADRNRSTRLGLLDELVALLGASVEGVLRGGEPIAAFVAILDVAAQTLTWSCAGHPGALVVTPGAVEPSVIPLGGGGARLGDPRGVTMRGVAPLGPDQMLVVASSGVRGGARGDDSTAWRGVVHEHAAAGPRLAGLLVDAAANRGQPGEDLLAIVVRQRRGDDRSATLEG